MDIDKGLRRPRMSNRLGHLRELPQACRGLITANCENHGCSRAHIGKREKRNSRAAEIPDTGRHQADTHPRGNEAQDCLILRALTTNLGTEARSHAHRDELIVELGRETPWKENEGLLG